MDWTQLQPIVEKFLPSLLGGILGAIISLGGLILNIRENRRKDRVDKRTELEKDYDRKNAECEQWRTRALAAEEKCGECDELRKKSEMIEELLARLASDKQQGKPRAEVKKADAQ